MKNILQTSIGITRKRTNKQRRHKSHRATRTSDIQKHTGLSQEFHKHFLVLIVFLGCASFSFSAQAQAAVFECFDTQQERFFTDSPIPAERCEVLDLDEPGQNNSASTASTNSPHIATSDPSPPTVDSSDFVAIPLSPLVNPENKEEAESSSISSVEAPHIPPMVVELMKQRFPNMEDIPWLFHTN